MAKDESAAPLLKNRSASSSDESDSIRFRPAAGAGDDGAMEESDDEETQERRRQQEEERRRELERVRSMPVGDTSGAMKIRTDYVPKRKFWLLFSLLYVLF